MQHLPDAHHNRHQVQFRIDVSCPQVSKYTAVAVQFFNVVRESVFRDAHEEALGQGTHMCAIVETEIDFRIVANTMTEVTHAEVQVMR